MDSCNYTNFIFNPLIYLAIILKSCLFSVNNVKPNEIAFIAINISLIKLAVFILALYFSGKSDITCPAVI